MWKSVKKHRELRRLNTGNLIHYILNFIKKRPLNKLISTIKGKVHSILIDKGTEVLLIHKDNILKGTIIKLSKIRIESVRSRPIEIMSKLTI